MDEDVLEASFTSDSFWREQKKMNLQNSVDLSKLVQMCAIRHPNKGVEAVENGRYTTPCSTHDIRSTAHRSQTSDRLLKLSSSFFPAIEKNSTSEILAIKRLFA